MSFPQVTMGGLDPPIQLPCRARASQWIVRFQRALARSRADKGERGPPSPRAIRAEGNSS
jgi:hypothetical protein